MKKLLISKIHIIHFLLIGGLNTIMGYMFFFILSYQFHYTIALFFSTLLSIIFNFFSYKYLYHHKKSLNQKHPPKKQFYKFLILYMLLYILNIILLYLLGHIINSVQINGFLIIFPSAYISYKVQKTSIFNS